MVESIIGAIFVDTLGNLKHCERFLDTLGLTTYLDRLLVDFVELQHPKTLLSMQASSKVIYRVETPDSSYNSYRCTVEIGSKSYGSVSSAVSREHVITIAAGEVLGKL